MSKAAELGQRRRQERRDGLGEGGQGDRTQEISVKGHFLMVKSWP